MYSVGLFYKENGEIDEFKHRNKPLQQPLQKIASDILGLDYKEVRPKIKKPNIQNRNTKQICIAPYASAQAKFWNNPTGWQEVINWLREKGYVVKLISKEENGYMGNPQLQGIEKHPDGPIELVIEEILKSDAFIGIGSGLSWLSWALKVPTILISGFSYNWAEMEDCIRIGAPYGKCVGCFNRVRLDAGDWNWCPDQKGTYRQFECTKSITAENVVSELKKLLQ
jgi:autotransporter strand-loop-strand O-heptosyltransferase